MTQKTLAKLEKITGAKLSLGKLIWAIRRGEELTQVDFAAQLGISKQQLCDIEHNRKSISPQLAAEYATKLGYSKKQFVRLALQDQLDRAGLHFNVDIQEAA
ncbi:MAG: transcriptional regulator [Coxiella sp. RIFCSPHIGHO2_12_FULL_42_15]|nr:MAG: transcriptional regulator [Coxiella sp. RIFCSPHIGHO2_12_FULL_42_15]